MKTNIDRIGRGGGLLLIPSALCVIVACNEPIVVLGSDRPLGIDSLETETVETEETESAEIETETWDSDIEPIDTFDTEHGDPDDSDHMGNFDSEHMSSDNFPEEGSEGPRDTEGDDYSNTDNMQGLVCEPCIRDFCACAAGTEDEQLIKSCAGLQAACLEAQCASGEAPNFGDVDCAPFGYPGPASQ
jgi:hypothetical protein